VIVWTGFIWLIKGPVVVSYEHGSECLGSIKGGKFLDFLIS
jgi:hypothetical protein